MGVALESFQEDPSLGDEGSEGAHYFKVAKDLNEKNKEAAAEIEKVVFANEDFKRIKEELELEADNLEDLVEECGNFVGDEDTEGKLNRLVEPFKKMV